MIFKVRRLKALQDNPDKKLVFEQLVEPTNGNYECRFVPLW